MVRELHEQEHHVAKKGQKRKVCFAVTPIGEEGSEIRRRSDQVLRYIIEPVMANLDYETVRADRISQPGMITNQVIEHLIDDDLVVADLTGSNPNVFYELAIRHATRKPIVTLIEAGERIPFDVNQSRTIQFTYRDLDSVAACKQGLGDQVSALEENPTDFFTPVSVAIDLKAMYESGNPEERRDAQVLAALQEVQAEVSQLGAEVSRLRGRVGTSSSTYTPIPSVMEPDISRYVLEESIKRNKRPGDPGYLDDLLGGPVPSDPRLAEADRAIAKRILEQDLNRGVEPGDKGGGG